MKIIKGFKVTNQDLECRNQKFELNEKYSAYGEINVGENGFHFVENLAHCFSYYTFDPNNRIFQIEASGVIEKKHGHTAAENIILVKELSWEGALQTLRHSQWDYAEINNIKSKQPIEEEAFVL